MARHIEDEVKYYYDSHSTEEDLMGETAFHRAPVQYLIEVLTWLFHGQVCAIHGNLNMYQTANNFECPVAPDVAVIKGVAYKQFTRSWRVGKSGPAPQVVFEIASEETWTKDLQENLQNMPAWECKKISPMILTKSHCGPAKTGDFSGGGSSQPARG